MGRTKRLAMHAMRSAAKIEKKAGEIFKRRPITGGQEKATPLLVNARSQSHNFHFHSLVLGP